MNKYQLLFIAIIGLGATLIYTLTVMVIPIWQQNEDYKQSEEFIQGREQMNNLRSLAPEGCSEGMHADNTCEILGMLIDQQKELREIKELLNSSRG